MEDRELLQMAAKAAGYKMECPDDPDGIFVIREGSRNGHQWNPLEDDGDALRLSVKLNLCVEVNGMFVHADCRHCGNDIGYFEENTARNDGCIFKSTRLAIVRAAAGIGESLP